MIIIDNFLFNNENEMRDCFGDFVDKVRLTRQSQNVNEYILRDASIGILGNISLNKLKTKVMGLLPYIQRTFSSSFCGVHPDIWIILNFYGEFTKHPQYIIPKIEEKFYAEILSSLNPSGRIIAFSLKEDYNELKNQYKNFNYNFVFDILVKDHKEYKDVNYIVKI